VIKWIEHIKLKATVDLPTIIVLGNKKDLAKAGNIAVSDDDIRELKAYESSIIFFETSARTGLNLDLVVD
jgi:translation elongation factor EF-Tu-like GTPase